jgi:hypothetical protein
MSERGESAIMNGQHTNRLKARLGPMTRALYGDCCRQAMARRLARGQSVKEPFRVEELVATPTGRALVAHAAAIGEQLAAMVGAASGN